MKRNLKLTLTGIVLINLFLSQIHAQTDFRPGYYITNSKDTIHGLIDYRGDIINATRCVYRSTQNDSSLVFLPGEIHGYRFVIGKFYVSKEIPHNDTSVIVFLEYIVNGIADLYYYRTSRTNHYYITHDNQNKIVELTNETKVKYHEELGNVQFQTNKHIGLLKATFSDSPETQKLAENTHMTHNSLIKIVTEYHENVCDWETCIEYEKKATVFVFSFGAQVGYHLNQLSIDNNRYYSSIDFNRSASVPFGFVANFMSPRVSERFSIQLEYIYSTAKYYGSGTYSHSSYEDVYTDMKIDLNKFDFNVLVKYELPIKNNKLYFAGGITVSIDDYKYYSEREVYTNLGTSYVPSSFYNQPLSNSFFGFNFNTGLSHRIREKIVVYGELEYSTLSANSENIDNNLKTFGINLGIFFQSKASD